MDGREARRPRPTAVASPRTLCQSQTLAPGTALLRGILWAVPGVQIESRLADLVKAEVVIWSFLEVLLMSRAYEAEVQRRERGRTAPTNRDATGVTAA